MNRHFYKEDMNGQQVYEKVLNFNNHQGNKNHQEIHSERLPRTSQDVYHKKKNNKQQMLVKMWRKVNPCALLEAV